eukprot:TRINITY_DN1578_c0_g1_i5.p2 TRINITY_DN1578_c0_g1~~TRINITY_DN1578_c0_g1_i5.p2  ORF type:complete len:608 (+),score=185.59 TRINITY_DN1578_c0_g1_i5:472-2295(+)
MFARQTLRLSPPPPSPSPPPPSPPPPSPSPPPPTCAPCTVKSQCHSMGVCDPATQKCTNPLKKDGEPCDDGSAETVNDACQQGRCVGHAACGGVDCVTQKACMTSSCNKQTNTCEDRPMQDGTLCDDGDDATYDDVCYGGQCEGKHSSPPPPSPPPPSPPPPPKPTCAPCKAKSQCHRVGKCNEDTLECSHPFKPQGTPCDDGDASTFNDECDMGACTGHQACFGQICAPGDPQCHVSECDTATHQCVERAKKDGTQCDDDNDMTVDDKCTSGRCHGTMRMSPPPPQRMPPPPSPPIKTPAPATPRPPTPKPPTPQPRVPTPQPQGPPASTPVPTLGMRMAKVYLDHWIDTNVDNAKSHYAWWDWYSDATKQAIIDGVTAHVIEVVIDWYCPAQACPSGTCPTDTQRLVALNCLAKVELARRGAKALQQLGDGGMYVISHVVVEDDALGSPDTRAADLAKIQGQIKTAIETESAEDGKLGKWAKDVCGNCGMQLGSIQTAPEEGETKQDGGGGGGGFPAGAVIGSAAGLLTMCGLVAVVVHKRRNSGGMGSTELREDLELSAPKHGMDVSTTSPSAKYDATQGDRPPRSPKKSESPRAGGGAEDVTC